MEQEPPAFLSAAGHPVRWGLLSRLAEGDRQVHELTALLGQPQNLVSYHLAKLRKAGLVTARRSSADRRDTYYALNLARCAALLADTGGALHPGLRMARPARPAGVPARVLFLCTGNSARSQMAEALLRRRTDGIVDARSAGSHPKPIHPHAVAAMAARGIDLAGARPKHLSELTAERFDRVITLCDKVREICPEFPGQTATHWSMSEPSERSDFDQLADVLDERIAFLLHTLKEAS